jgi:CheY-like chemotaxis protein
MSHGFVLVVDDDDDIRELTVLLIDSDGIPALGAEDGYKALEAIERHGVPGVIILDLRMPNLNGEEFLKRLRSVPRLAAVPVVLVSGDRYTEKAAEKLKAQAVLTKPYDGEVLLQVLRRVMKEQDLGAQHPA